VSASGKAGPPTPYRCADHPFHRASAVHTESLKSSLSIPGSDHGLSQLDGPALVGKAWIAGSPLVYIAEGAHHNFQEHKVPNYGVEPPRDCGDSIV
jgi:hypothetical protein